MTQERRGSEHDQGSTAAPSQDETTELPAQPETTELPAQPRATEPAAHDSASAQLAQGLPATGYQAPSALPHQAGGPAGWASPFPPMAPDHPQAVTILVLGIVGILGIWVTSPIAWYLGNQALREIDATPGAYGHRDFVVIGRILGIVGTVLLGVALAVLLLFVLFYLGLFAVFAASS